MRLIVHAGTHKTGTTSIQKALSENREWLAVQGFYYPYAIPPYSNSLVPHHKFAHHLTGVNDAERDLAVRFAEEMIRRKGSTHTVIISTEALYRHVVDYNSWRKYAYIEDYWERRAQYLARFRSLFSQMDIQVILFFRNKRAFVESFVRGISKGRWDVDKASLDSFAAHRPQLLEYDRQRQLFENHLGPVKSVSYEDVMERGGSVTEFFRLVGCELPASADEIWERNKGAAPNFN